MINHKILLLLIIYSGLIPFRSGYASDTMILAVHPYLPVDEINQKFTPLAQYLGKQLGKKVSIKVGSNYQEHIDFIGSDKVDIAYMGPASYVNMAEEYGHKPMLAMLEIRGHSYFQGNIIISSNSDIKTVHDLKGKRIAFGDPNSTMSYIVPHYLLHKQGVYNKHSGKHDFLNSHNNVAISVLTGDFDAGAVKPAVFKKYKDRGLKTLIQTPKISEHLFITRANFPVDDINKLRSAMLDMKNSPEGLAALHSIKKSITALVEANSGDYDNLKTIIIESRKLH